MTDELPDECCAKCRFHFGFVCRRYPKVLFTVTETSNPVTLKHWAHPPVDAREWCGEFQPKELRQTPVAATTIR